MLSELLSDSETDSTDGSSSSGSGSALTPALGPIRGGTIVSVTGQNFLNTETLSCRFGEPSYTVIARYITAVVLECVTPPHPLGSVDVKVSLNGQQYATIGSSFLYQEMPFVTAIEPYRGPSEGGTLMILHGMHFSIGVVSVCRVGSVTVPATVLSSTMMECTTPANPPGYVSVEITNNLQDFSNSGILYHYHLVSIMQVFPHYTSQLGGDEITIVGNNFVPPHEGELLCMIGTSTPVVARWDSENMLTCETQVTF